MKPKTITINLKALREKITFKAFENEAETDLARLMDPANSNIEFAARLRTADECTIVTHACGSCTYGNNQGYLVEYFCGSGGSDPDFARCEEC